jgi:hypothetical protein
LGSHFLKLVFKGGEHKSQGGSKCQRSDEQDLYKPFAAAFSIVSDATITCIHTHALHSSKNCFSGRQQSPLSTQYIDHKAMTTTREIIVPVDEVLPIDRDTIMQAARGMQDGTDPQGGRLIIALYNGCNQYIFHEIAVCLGTPDNIIIMPDGRTYTPKKSTAMKCIEDKLLLSFQSISKAFFMPPLSNGELRMYTLVDYLNVCKDWT